MTESEGRTPQQNPANTRPTEVDAAEISSVVRPPGYGEEFLAQHRRRHDAARGLPPLGPCGCIRDPGHDRHRCADVLTDHQLDSWEATIDHLTGRGTPAIVPARVRRALRDRGAA
jgi:hypothetical protein